MYRMQNTLDVDIVCVCVCVCVIILVHLWADLLNEESVSGARSGRASL